MPRDDARGAQFDSLDHLLQTRFDDPDVPFCHLLVDAKPAGSSPAAVPWVTPIVGSGAHVSDYSQVVLDEVAAAARRACATVDTNRQAAAKRFAATLAKGRLRRNLEPASLESVENEQTTLADAVLGLVLLATADLTNAYHQVSAWTSTALDRDGEDIALLPTGFPEEATVRAQFVATAYASLTALSDAYGQFQEGGRWQRNAVSRLHQAAAGLVQRARQQLGGRDAKVVRIDLTSVQLMTEYCWLLMSGATQPGWSDLLWRLYTVQQDWAEARSRRGPRPIAIDAARLAKALKRNLEGAIGEAWQARRDGLRDDVHSAVVELLRAECKFRAAWPPNPQATKEFGGKPPLVSAFVTSLDLELELALAVASEPYFVLVPAYVERSVAESEPSERTLIWLGLFVPAEINDPKLLQEPSADRWFVASGATSQDWLAIEKRFLGPAVETARQSVPIIVRLTGAPLIHLPRQNDDDEASQALYQRVADVVEWEELSNRPLQHAILIDEFVNIQSSALDRTPSDEGSMSFDSALVQANADYASRFWLLLGVQVDDPAVRSRVGLEVSASIPRPPDPVPRRSGLAINERFAGSAEDLLRLLGLDVVRAQCDELIPGMLHYAEHLSRVQPSLMPIQNDPDCGIEDD